MMDRAHTDALDRVMAWLRSDEEWLEVWQDFFLSPIEPLMAELEVDFTGFVEKIGTGPAFFFIMVRLEDFIGLRHPELPGQQRPVDAYLAARADPERERLLAVSESLPGLYRVEGAERALRLHDLIGKTAPTEASSRMLGLDGAGVPGYLAGRVFEFEGQPSLSPLILGFGKEQVEEMIECYEDVVNSYAEDLRREQAAQPEETARTESLRLLGVLTLLWLQIAVLPDS
jgi:hypothetical protein